MYHYVEVPRHMLQKGFYHFKDEIYVWKFCINELPLKIIKAKPKSAQIVCVIS